MKARALTACMAAALCAALAAPAWADVFAMPGGQTSLEFVSVGNLGNVGDTVSMWQDGTTGYGVVDYAYNISKYEVTVAQYTQFLNAVAASDPYGLYRDDGFGSSMSDDTCGIVRSGSDGSYTYSVGSPAGPPPGPGQANRPVTHIDWGDSVRFANWVHNGQGPGDTETGAYTLDGAMTDAEFGLVTRNEGAVYALPTEDEWYKAAYHKNDGPTGNYWFHPTASDSSPSRPADMIPTTNNATILSGTYPPAPYRRTEVGHWTTSPSPYGTFDQGGNVDEWTETAVGQKHVRRGGGWGSGTSPGANWRLTKLAHQIGDKHGFRLYKRGSIVPGDFDGDGDVDADDIDILCDNLGGDPATYDVDEDGDVDADDMVYLIENLAEWDNGADTGVGTKQGDFNLDGVVNATDLAIMKGTFGTSGVGYAEGNANCDTVVNATDLAILKGNFGFTAPTGGDVPEPMTVGLLGFGGLAMLRRRRSIRK